MFFGSKISEGNLLLLHPQSYAYEKTKITTSDCLIRIVLQPTKRKNGQDYNNSCNGRNCHRYYTCI